ncbi:MAG: Flagellar biosynthetic protein FlhB, partial [Planctomycetota bacterium]
MAEDLGEGTEDATPKRRREAREEGNIARSQDASGAILLLGAILILAATIKPMIFSLAAMLENALGGDAMRALRAEDAVEGVAPTLTQGAFAAAPVVLGALALGVLAHLWQVGFLVTTKPLEPKLE